jgi:ribosome hibernation promoting factor
MRLQVKGKNLDVSDSIRDYAERKLAKLNGRVHEQTQVEVELAVERNPSIAANQVAEATIWLKGPDVVRAREASPDMKASIDELLEKLLRQLEHHRDKKLNRRNGRVSGASDGGQTVTELDPQIVKTKQFVMEPMHAEEAVLQLELVGHDFFVFQNADSNSVNVVYRRRNGGYGLIEPQL